MNDLKGIAFHVIQPAGPRWNWGEFDKLNLHLLTEFDRFLHEQKIDAIVTCGTQGQHVEHSFHGKGEALDSMYPRTIRRELPDVFFAALRYGFTGLGLYSEWHLSPGGASVGGIHLDVRAVETKALWLKGPGGYEALKWARVKELFK